MNDPDGKIIEDTYTVVEYPDGIVVLPSDGVGWFFRPGDLGYRTAKRWCEDRAKAKQEPKP